MHTSSVPIHRHIKIQLKGDFVNFPLVVENVHQNSILQTDKPDATVNESIQNSTRHLVIDGKISNMMEVSWLFPVNETYRFMAIGDSGGGKELEWLIRRAIQLDCDFIFHLGDMFYSHQDVQSAFKVINNSPIPVYNVYGNHDYYNHNNYEYPERGTFEKYFSPPNFQFELLDKAFVSLDTSSHIIPLSPRAAR